MLPVAFVLAAITPTVLTKAMDVVTVKLTREGRSICPPKRSLPVLFSFLVVALVDCSIRPCLRTVSVLPVVQPITLVVCTVIVHVLAESACAIIFPCSNVHVSVGVDHTAASIGLVVLPVSDVFAAIAPDLLSFSVSFLSSLRPLSGVLCTSFEHHFGPLFKCGAVFWQRSIVEGTELAFDLVDCFVGIYDAVRGNKLRSEIGA